MKIKLDENIPHSAAAFLQQMGYDVDTVLQEGLSGETDARIWQAAQAESRFLITQDLDFSDINKFAPGTHHGILILRLRNSGRVALFQRIRVIFDTEDAESWEGGFVVVTERKIRVRSAK